MDRVISFQKWLICSQVLQEGISRMYLFMDAVHRLNGGGGDTRVSLLRYSRSLTGNRLAFNEFSILRHYKGW